MKKNEKQNRKIIKKQIVNATVDFGRHCGTHNGVIFDHINILVPQTCGRIPIEHCSWRSIWESNRACSWRINLVDHREPFEIPFMGQIDSHRGKNQTKAGFVQPGQSCLIDRNHFNLTIAVDYKFWCPPKKSLDLIGPKLLDFSSLKLWLYCLLRLILVILVDLV